MSNESSGASHPKLDFEMEQVHLTLEHIREVQNLLMQCSADLIERAIKHDTSKFLPDEWQYFLTHTQTLAGLTYDSDEYKKALEEMRPGIENHYKRNRHHPEHHIGWMRDMTLLDLLEMLCDWMVATKRHKNGDIFKSIELNQQRFSYGFDVKQIFKNTARAIQNQP